MSGHSGFAPIGNNGPRPIVNNVPVADNIVNDNPVNIVQEGGEPIVPVNAQPRAADVVGQLDILLMKAAKNVATLTGKESVRTAATAAGLPKATVKSLASLAEAAQKSVAALDRFNGHQLAAAMEKKPDGTIDWKPKDDAAKAIKEAQDAQVKLSSVLADALGKAKDGATQAALEEIMLQCDRRVAEIETLCLQMAEIVERGGDKVQDEAEALAGGKLSAFTSKDALDKFDRGSALTAMKAEIKPLADRLAGYASGAKSLTEEDVASCTVELNALKTKLSEAGASGKLVVGNKTVFCDRSMLAEAARMLDGVGDKIASMHRDIIKGAMNNLVENSFPFLKHELFAEKFIRDLAKVKSQDGATAGVLANCISRMNDLRNAARAYASSPTAENKAKLANAAKALQDMDRDRAAECLDEDFISEARYGKGTSNEFKTVFDDFKTKIKYGDGDKLLQDFKKTIFRLYDNIDIAVEQLLELGKKVDASPESKVYVSSWVLDAFRGEQKMSTIVEARAHGYNDSEIDPKIDDANVAKTKELGSGAFNTVTLLKLKDGSEWVFKPELPGSLMAPNSPFSHGMAKNMELTRINLAVKATADAFGLNDVMVETKAGSHKGQFGMFMEKAPGLTCGNYLKAGSRNVGDGKLSMSDLRKLDDEKFGKVVGRMMRQANRMMWFDILTGQGDRHNGNYLVEIDKETLAVSMKGIDNDASYGVLRTGINSFTLPAGSLAQGNFFATLKGAASSSGDKDAFMDVVKSDPGLKLNDDNSIEINLDKVVNKQLVQGLLHYCGFKSVVVPEEIDAELYDKLMALAPNAPDGGAARTAYLDSLSTRLGAGSEQYKCAVNRLDEAIARARKLKAEGKVYSAAEWETRDVQRNIAKVALGKAKNDDSLPNLSRKHRNAIKIRSDYTGSTNFVMRDMYETLTQSGKHTDWFE
jgi:hypothetical protein